ncbi:hypothetical protein [Streptomyces sp. NPDC048392]|uniref:hypothetical protein n=1 Tax=Streptomyces sp. NPDC048392 TaxID=3365543 RepID=UPI003711BA65
MNKNSATINYGFVGQLSKVFVTERLGLDPQQHQLTAEGTWIRLAARLMATPAPTYVRHANVKHKGGKR